MKKGTVIMVCGLPGAGKTTFAKKLEKERKAVRFCPDEWIIPLLKDPTDMDEAKRIRTPLEKLMFEQAIILANLGVNVILENGFWTKVDRDHHKVQLKKAGLRIELFFLDAPLNVLWERVKKRNKKDYPFKVSLAYLKKWHKIFGPPTEEEIPHYDFYKNINKNL
ncbi:MAG: AAA family ATPase [Candidatus Levybacteria bacterium]|nr:AAA family ATPase [Candidatus Levybacteria bacterium]